MVDGPFDPAQKPWLLSNQHRFGIEQQPVVSAGGREFYKQLPGPTRGTRRPSRENDADAFQKALADIPQDLDLFGGLGEPDVEG